MAKVISEENLGKLETEMNDLELVIPELQKEVESFDTLMEDSKLLDLIMACKDSAPGLSRSLNATRKVLVEEQANLVKLLQKTRNDHAEISEKYNKSKANKERVPTGGAGKSGWVLMPAGEQEVPAGPELSKDIKFWGSQFRGTVKENIVLAKYSGSLLSGINTALGSHWDGQDLRVREGKRELLMYRSQNGEVVFRKGN